MPSDSAGRLLTQLSLQTQLQQHCTPLGQIWPWSAVLSPETPLVLYRVKQTEPIAYRSPLLQQLSTKKPAELVTQLLTQLPPHQDWQVQLTPQHRLEFQWRTGAIAPYLQVLHRVEWGTNTDHQAVPLSQLTMEQLQLQYCHGRCYSLLQLAQREEWIIPEQPDWLSLDAEWDRAFFAVWLDCGDRLALKPHILKPLLPLTQAWHTWYAHSRVWGTAKHQSPHVAQARLCTIELTQKLLSWSLREIGGLTPWRST